MARTESTMVQLGTIAPPFELIDVLSGRTVRREDVLAPAWGLGAGTSDANNSLVPGGAVRKRGLLVMFVCVHCPYVKHVEAELARLGQDYFQDGAGPLAVVAIQSNDVQQYPEDGPDGMRRQAQRLGWQFPYLLDATQEVARSYEAACTPDFFLFNSELQLVYRGQLDSSRPRRGDSGNDQPVTGQDLRAAIEAVLAGRPPDQDQRGSIGCNIKWR